jgi:hypothetical protein
MLGCNCILKRLVARKQLHNPVMLHGSLWTQRKAACNMQPVTFCTQLGGSQGSCGGKQMVLGILLPFLCTIILRLSWHTNAAAVPISVV